MLDYISLTIAVFGFMITIGTILFKAGRQDSKIEDIAQRVESNSREDRATKQELQITIGRLKDDLKNLQISAASNSEMVKTLFAKTEESKMKQAELEAKHSATIQLVSKVEATLEHLMRETTEVKNLLLKK